MTVVHGPSSSRAVAGHQTLLVLLALAVAVAAAVTVFVVVRLTVESAISASGATDADVEPACVDDLPMTGTFC